MIQSLCITDSHDSKSTKVVGNIANGEELYITCSACHGPDGIGIDGMGRNLVNGESSLTATDDELASVIINGRPIWDETITTMLDMPPRGGNPALTDEDIMAYIRSLQPL